MKNLIFKILLKIFKIPVVPKKDYLDLLARFYHAKGVSSYNLAQYNFIRGVHEKDKTVKARLFHKECEATYLRKEFYRLEDRVRHNWLDGLKWPAPYKEANHESVE